MLQVDLRELRHGPVEIAGKLGPADPLFEGLAVPLDGPVTVGGTLERAGHGGYLWHGRFEGRVRCACRRCLTEFVSTVAEAVEVVFSSDPELQDDPSVYPLNEPGTQVDVRPRVVPGEGAGGPGGGAAGGARGAGARGGSVPAGSRGLPGALPAVWCRII